MTHPVPARLRHAAALATCIAALGLNACAGMSQQTRETSIGAGVGAAAGAVITGTTTGAAVGAVIGGVIGHENDDRDEKNKKK